MSLFTITFDHNILLFPLSTGILLVTVHDYFRLQYFVIPVKHWHFACNCLRLLSMVIFFIPVKHWYCACYCLQLFSLLLLLFVQCGFINIRVHKMIRIYLFCNNRYVHSPPQGAMLRSSAAQTVDGNLRVRTPVFSSSAFPLLGVT